MIDYKAVIINSSFGYAYHRLILDEKGKPADYEFLDVNAAFEKLTGMKKDNITGLRVTDLIPDIKKDTFDWIGFYGKAVLSKKGHEIEKYSESLKKWHRIEVIPMEGLCFAALFIDITTLKENISQMKQYLHYSPKGIFITDKNGRYIIVNQAACKLLGYNENQLLTMSITDIVPPDNRDIALSLFKTFREKKDVSDEVLLQRSDGTTVWVELASVALPDGTFMAYCIDISHRKKSETELKELLHFNKTLLNTIPAPIYYKNKEGRYLGVNNAFADFYGKSQEEMTGHTVFEIAPPELAEIYYKMDNNLILNHGVQVYESQIENSKGEFHDVIFHKATFNDLNGETGGLIGVILDITERKKAEKELELYYRAMQSIDQPVLITDNKGRIIRVNKAFIRLYGFSIEELEGENPRILNPGKNVYLDLGYTEEEHARLFKSMWEAITNKEVGTWENVVINRKKDGTIVWVRLFINVVYDDNGVPINYIALPVDISGTVQKEVTTRIQLYQTIAGLAELRDNETGNHMRRVGIFAKLIAREYGMPEKYCNDIEIFAPLHDIGKVGISDYLLLAGRKLTQEEFEIMKTHTIMGHNIVKGKKELEMVAAITISHHEWFNGDGYPNSLAGKDIPLSARITAIADVYDALRNKRPYKVEWDHVTSRDYIINKSGKQFDPSLVEIFIKVNDKFDIIFNELKDNPA